MAKRIDTVINKLIEISKEGYTESNCRQRFEMVVSSAIADAINLQLNIIETSLPGKDREQRELDLAKDFGVFKSGTGKYC